MLKSFILGHLRFQKNWIFSLAMIHYSMILELKTSSFSSTMAKDYCKKWYLSFMVSVDCNDPISFLETQELSILMIGGMTWVVVWNLLKIKILWGWKFRRFFWKSSYPLSLIKNGRSFLGDLKFIVKQRMIHAFL